jgi:two-component system chemotaxis response regulator CheY
MRVLVIDDQQPMRQTVRRILESAGHEVIEADDGHAGLAAFHAHAPDVVVTDILMPAMDGIETIRTLRAIAPDLRIVAISGSRASLDLLRYAREFGATTAISKPFRKAELLAAVHGETDLR